MVTERCQERVADNNDFIDCGSPVVPGRLDMQRRPSCIEHAVTDRIEVDWVTATFSHHCTVCKFDNGKVARLSLGPYATIRLCTDCASELAAKLAEKGLKHLG